MKKEFVNKSQVIENNGYLKEEFEEYYGKDCVGIWAYIDDDGDEVACVCKMSNGKYVYRECGVEWEFDSLKEFEEWSEI